MILFLFNEITSWLMSLFVDFLAPLVLHCLQCKLALVIKAMSSSRGHERDVNHVTAAPVTNSEATGLHRRGLQATISTSRGADLHALAHKKSNSVQKLPGRFIPVDTCLRFGLFCFSFSFKKIETRSKETRNRQTSCAAVNLLPL